MKRSKLIAAMELRNHIDTFNAKMHWPPHRPVGTLPRVGKPRNTRGFMGTNGEWYPYGKAICRP